MEKKNCATAAAASKMIMTNDDCRPFVHSFNFISFSNPLRPSEVMRVDAHRRVAEGLRYKVKRRTLNCENEE